MKTKIFALCAFLLVTTSIFGQLNYHSLSQSEIDECKTPQSVAWNFVMSIIENDYNRMNELTSDSFKQIIQEMMEQVGVKTFKEFFTEKNIHDICGMRPVLKKGYHLVCTDEYYHEIENNDKTDELYGIQVCDVHFDCSNKKGELYSESSKRQHDTTARVILAFINEKWQVIGFK